MSDLTEVFLTSVVDDDNDDVEGALCIDPTSTECRFIEAAVEFFLQCEYK